MLMAVFSGYAGDHAPRAAGYIGDVFVAFHRDGRFGVLDVRGRASSGLLQVRSIQNKLLDDTLPQDPNTMQVIRKDVSAQGFKEAITMAAATGPRFLSRGNDNTFGVVRHGFQYAGSQVCQMCHRSQFEQWLSTGHSASLTGLVVRRRHRDPSCIKCHVTGFGAPSGYTVIGITTHLANVGCEACHGPGLAHASDPQREKVVLDSRPELCVSCHDPEYSSLSERAAAYYARIVH